MFNLFRTPRQKLERMYQQLLEESFRLSHIDRKKSDLKAAEAEEIRKQLEFMDKTAT